MNQDFQIRHGSKHYRPCNQYKHHFHRSHHRSILGGWSVNKPYSKLLSTYLVVYLGVRMRDNCENEDVKQETWVQILVNRE